MKRLSAILAMLILVLVGCSSEPEQTTVSIVGSTSVESFVKETLAPEIKNELGVDIEYQATGSSDGIKAATEGTADFGTSSRELKGDETSLSSQILAHDGIAIITNQANEVNELTLEQVTQIYKGEITNWSEVGGADENIVVVSREDGSGTRSAMEELAGFENELVDGATIAEGNGNVASTVAENPNAIGYVSFTTLEDNSDTVSGVTINGAEPTPINVQAGTYPLSRPFLLVYQEENLTETDTAVLEWIQTTGVTYAPDAGLIEA